MIRHGKKNGENIAVEELEQIRQAGIPGVNELLTSAPIFIHEGTALLRTRQTVLALEEYLLKFPEKYLIAGRMMADANFGNSELFAEFFLDEKIIEEANRTNWFDAFCRCNPRFVRKIQERLIGALKETFYQMDDDQLVITVGHTPSIEWLGFALDSNKILPSDLQLKELTGMVITQNEKEIKISRTIGF